MKKSVAVLKYSICVILVIVISACAAYPKEAFRGYAGDIRPKEELSVMKMDENVVWLMVDGYKIAREEFGEIILLPGIYKIEWGTHFNVSVLVKTSMRDDRIWSGRINLQPGHTYTIFATRSLGFDYSVRSWIEDSAGVRAKIMGLKAKEVQDIFG